jgi:hypothetical protein
MVSERKTQSGSMRENREPASIAERRSMPCRPAWATRSGRVGAALRLAVR